MGIIVLQGYCQCVCTKNILVKVQKKLLSYQAIYRENEKIMIGTPAITIGFADLTLPVCVMAL